MRLIAALFICGISTGKPAFAKSNTFSNQPLIKLSKRNPLLLKAPAPVRFDFSANHKQPQRLDKRKLLMTTLEKILLPEHKAHLNKVLAQQGIFAFLKQQGLSDQQDVFKLLDKPVPARTNIRSELWSLKQYAKDIDTPTGIISESGFLVQVDF